MPVDFMNLPPLFSHQGNEGNHLKIDVNSILAIIFQMAYNKLYIPLSVLTTASLDRICSNQNLRFCKVPFSNGSGKQKLDDSSFPTEGSLDATTFLQAYRNWLTVVDHLANSILAGGSHSHYDCMIADPCSNMHLSAWHALNKTLCSQFMIKPLLIDTKNPTYFALFECYCNSFSQRFNAQVSTPFDSFPN